MHCFNTSIYFSQLLLCKLGEKKYKENWPKSDESMSGNPNLHLLPVSKNRLLKKTTSQMGFGSVDPFQTYII